MTARGGSRDDGPILVQDEHPERRAIAKAQELIGRAVDAWEGEEWQGENEEVILEALAGAQQELSATAAMLRQQPCWDGLAERIARDLRWHELGTAQYQANLEGLKQVLGQDCDDTCPCFDAGREAGIEQAREAGP